MAKPTFLAIIPARGGSKGLPKKNIIDVAGKPLIAWTIEAAIQSRFISDVFVSSDDSGILELSKKLGAKIILRPDNLALDTTATEPVLLHAINWVEAKGEQYDYLILLQPTSPARNALDIDQAVEEVIFNNASSLISVYEPDQSPFKALRVNEKGSLISIINDKLPSKRRQDLPKAYMPNGAIYIVSIPEFKKNSSLLTEHCIPFIMPIDKSIDIDTVQDISDFLTLLEAHREKS